MSDDHWLTRPASIRKLWFVLAAILAATVVAEIAIPNKPHFAFERLFAFNALYGFLACVAMVLVAKALALVLKRRDTYYEERDDD